MGPMTNDNDGLLAEKLRREDPEQYHTLIRMHLSFLLDLNTDETDSTSDKVKSRVLKWNLLPFSKKSKPSTKGVMEGAPLTQEGICQVYQLIEYLSKEQSIQQEGIFRRSGKLRRQQELKGLLNQGITLDLSAGHYSVHDCASVLKNFLAELPEPLLTDAHYPAHFQIAEMCAAGAEGKSDSRLLTALQLLLLLLPAENRVLLSDLLNLLHLTASYQHVNRMSAESLATLFTPHLACPRKMPPEALHTNAQLMSRVIAFMIRQGPTSLFSIPPQLATDIRAYWARKESNESEPSRKSPVFPVQVYVGCNLKGDKKAEGESAEVNTVFSFVDRERTAQAHNTNTTEAALAQLYAHIRSLPESSEKRRLVKQFNKENGLGTPHQHYPRILNPRARSLGDSIKKHLFNKGIKCPKNGVHQGHFNVLQQASTDKSNETMMTPRSRKPVLVLSGSNISNFSSMVQCSHLHSGEKGDQSSLKCKREGSITKLETPRKKETIGPFSKLNFAEPSVSASTPSTSKNEPIPTTDDLKNSDSESLSSTFVNYLQSRSVLTATPVDLSFNEENSLDEIDFKSLKSEEELSESLLYCLDGNAPPCDSSSSLDHDKVNVSPPKDKCQSRPLKRTSTEAQNEDLVNSHASVMKLVSTKHQKSHDSIRVNSTPDVPKNTKVFETSL